MTKLSLHISGLILMAAISVSSCTSNSTSQGDGRDSISADTIAVPEKGAFESTISGKQTSLYVLRNKNNVQAAFTNYGARLVSLLVPDKNSRMTDVVTGFASLDGYLKSTEVYYGATIGRYGNRIAKGSFTLDGTPYTLKTNNGANSLHGGPNGFHNVVWEARQTDERTVVFTYLSPDMEEGFPGNLKTQVTYALTDDNTVTMEYEATTDKKTVVNLTNHAFFNLNGEGSGPVLGHLVQINANEYLPVDSTLIPFGPKESVKGTPFDFTTPATIGQRIGDKNQQLQFGQGYDHNYVLSGNKDATGMVHAARVTGEKSGIVMDIFTTEPGMQFYSGNFMKGANVFKNGSKDDFRYAFCMETQHFPDSPNKPDYPSTVLDKGNKYYTRSEYKFSVLK